MYIYIYLYLHIVYIYVYNYITYNYQLIPYWATWDDLSGVLSHRSPAFRSSRRHLFLSALPRDPWSWRCHCFWWRVFVAKVKSYLQWYTMESQHFGDIRNSNLWIYSIYVYICEYDYVRMSDWGGCPVLRLLQWSLIFARHSHWKPKFVYRIAYSVEDVLNYFSVFQRDSCFSRFSFDVPSTCGGSFPRDLAAWLYNLGFKSKTPYNFKIWTSNLNQLQSIHIHIHIVLSPKWNSTQHQAPISHCDKVDLVGDRLCYDRIAGNGAGPDSGWVWAFTIHRCPV